MVKKAKADATMASFTDPALLTKIDNLFACGVGEHVALPQLVVVGDQSSGKSSVLEGLTKLPFPRDSGLCTRFATQITFKRHQEKRTSIYVIPAQNAVTEHQAKLRAWSKPNIEELGREKFVEIMKEVQELMGLGSQNQPGSSGTFSEDVLRLELSGPEQQHLSIVDIPGIFRKTTQGQTTAEDRDMVKSMVHSYMKNPRSVMLTVIPANVDIATQEILSMAEDVDPEGLRTIGVLTKPDLVDRGGEQSILDLVKGVKHKLTLGWQIVRNPGQSDISRPETSVTARDRSEAAFFASSPWNSIGEENRGIDSLRSRLQDILTSHIRREFPKVQNEITQRLVTSSRKLNDLGAKRGTTYEQRIYLTNLCTSFQKIVQDALSTQYTARCFDEYPSLRLPTYVINRNEQFKENMKAFGHLYEFEDGVGKKSSKLRDDGINSLESLLDAIQATKEARSIHSSVDGFKVRMPVKFPELFDCTISDSIRVQTEPRPGITTWLNQQHTSSKGFELGSVNPVLLNTLFREQTVKWDDLANGYLSDVIEMVHSFITDSMKVAVPDEQVRESLTAKLMDQLLDIYQKASTHTDFLLKVEKESVLMTSNRYFSDNLQKSRSDRMKSSQEDSNQNGEKAISPNDLIYENMSNRELEIQDLHDVLKSYYKVALRRFVDNVCHQAALYHLIKGPESPLELFSASFVNRLTDDELEEIAGEDALLKRKRANLEKEIKDLESGKAVLR